MTTPVGGLERDAGALSSSRTSRLLITPKVAGSNPAPAMEAAMAPDPEMALRFAWTTYDSCRLA